MFKRSFWSILRSHLEEDQDQWVLWIPILTILGSVFFLSFLSPTWKTILVVASFGGLGGVLGMRLSSPSRVLPWIVFWTAVGFLAMSWCVYRKPFDLLQSPQGPLWVQARVASLDHTATSKRICPRIILDHFQVVSDPFQKEGTPLYTPLKRVRVSIRTPCPPLQEGDVIKTRIKIFPWPCPSTPWGYDAQFHGFFQGVQGYGFSLSAVVRVQEDRSFLSRQRHHLTRLLHQKMPRPLSIVACALVTGDKAALPPDIRQAFASSGLSHILAISGLHLAIVSGLCFGFFHRLFTRYPQWALRYDLKKGAAIAALIVGWMYLVISGCGYPAQRAFSMMTLTIIAMFLKKKPFSLRLLAFIATGFLLYDPYVAFNIGFQLSFVATASLMGLSYNALFSTKQSKTSNFLINWAETSLLSTTAATFSTLPFIAFHFQQMSFQSLLSNLVAVTYTSCCIIPLGIAALASLITPFSAPFLWAWGLSLEGLIWIARMSASHLSWMLFHVPPYPSWLFVIQVYTTWWILLWKRPWRWWGCVVWIFSMAAIFIFYFKPDVLRDPSSGIYGFIDYPNGTLWVSSLRKGRFVTKRWADAFHLATIRLIPDGYRTEQAPILKPGVSWPPFDKTPYGQAYFIKPNKMDVMPCKPETYRWRFYVYPEEENN